MNWKPLVLALASCLSFASAVPLPEEAELLASNTVRAVYRGTMHRPCMARTADCPDRCGHAATLACFDVLENLDYQKPGKYGDDEAQAGSRLLVGLDPALPGQEPQLLENIAALAPGAMVQMTVTHYYVNVGNAQYPVRPVTALEVLPGRQEVAPLQPEDDPRHKIMPLR